jgi:hypothetical protein
MQLGIRRAKTGEEGQGKKERLRVNGCPDKGSVDRLMWFCGYDFYSLCTVSLWRSL